MKETVIPKVCDISEVTTKAKLLRGMGLSRLKDDEQAVAYSKCVTKQLKEEEVGIIG